jgi:hypothetical protein
MSFWITLWKIVLVVLLSGFGLMALWVTIQGARDIFALLEHLKARHKTGDPENT